MEDPRLAPLDDANIAIGEIVQVSERQVVLAVSRAFDRLLLPRRGKPVLEHALLAAVHTARANDRAAAVERDLLMRRTPGNQMQRIDGRLLIERFSLAVAEDPDAGGVEEEVLVRGQRVDCEPVLRYRFLGRECG